MTADTLCHISGGKEEKGAREECVRERKNPEEEDDLEQLEGGQRATSSRGPDDPLAPPEGRSFYRSVGAAVFPQCEGLWLHPKEASSPTGFVPVIPGCFLG